MTDLHELQHLNPDKTPTEEDPRQWWEYTSELTESNVYKALVECKIIAGLDEYFFERTTCPRIPWALVDDHKVGAQYIHSKKSITFSYAHGIYLAPLSMRRVQETYLHEASHYLASKMMDKYGMPHKGMSHNVLFATIQAVGYIRNNSLFSLDLYDFQSGEIPDNEKYRNHLQRTDGDQTKYLTPEEIAYRIKHIIKWAREAVEAGLTMEQTAEELYADERRRRLYGTGLIITDELKREREAKQLQQPGSTRLAKRSWW